MTANMQRITFSQDRDQAETHTYLITGNKQHKNDVVTKYSTT